MQKYMYTIYLKDKNILCVTGIFENEDLINNNTNDNAIFIRDNGLKYIIPMSNILYIKAEPKKSKTERTKNE